MRTRPKESTSAWDNTPHRNLLSPENLERVRRQFGKEGVIFGWHYYYAGGGSGSMFAFSDYASYYQELIQSRPGDHFTVYSPDMLLDQAIARIGSVTSDQPILIDDSFAEVKNALAAGKEVAFLRRHAAPETGSIECDAGVLWDLAEGELEQCLGLRSGRRGEFLFFLTDTLDEDQERIPIASVSAIGGRRRVHAVVDGKRPRLPGSQS